jgi:subtilisin family serine protease
MGIAEELPAWSLPDAARAPSLASPWPHEVTRAWAWGGSTGRGVRVAVLDSGVEAGHPLVGGLEQAVAVTLGDDGEPLVEPDEEGDACGHGTACAGIVRSLAPDCRLTSVRVLGAGGLGGGDVLIAGLRWAIEQRYEVVNLSLSTTKRRFAAALYELADRAWFARSMLVVSAHNLPVESWPWRFASVLSVASHAGEDPLTFFSNPEPPVDFYARGVGVEAAWTGGATVRCTGNSFATPHLAAICALVRAKHPTLSPLQLKNVLHLTADNVTAS